MLSVLVSDICSYSCTRWGSSRKLPLYPVGVEVGLRTSHPSQPYFRVKYLGAVWFGWCSWFLFLYGLFHRNSAPKTSFLLLELPCRTAWKNYGNCYLLPVLVITVACLICQFWWSVLPVIQEKEPGITN